MIAVAVDTETLSLRSSAVILSIGVVWFDMSCVSEFNDLIKNGINLYLDQNVQKKMNRHVCPKTTAWWKEQNEEAARLFSETGIHPSKAAKEIENFLERVPAKKSELRWFCRGPQFDIAKLEDLYTQFDIPTHWSYRKPRCSRTFLDAFGIEDDKLIKRPVGMIPHNSMHDAAFEGYILQRVYNGTDIEFIEKDKKAST